MAKFIPTVSVDFDGVLHSYTSGWRGVGVINDPPVDGAIEFLLRLLARGYRPAIFSTRSRSLRGRRAMKRWLRRHAGRHYGEGLAHAHLTDEMRAWSDAAFYSELGASYEARTQAAAAWLEAHIAWPLFKPPALVTVDDRAICFEGSFAMLVHEIEAFRPWNKR